LDVLHPTVDTLFGQPCLAVHVQPHLVPDAQARLHALQQEAVACWPGGFHQAPAHALHVTVYPVVPTTEGFDKDAYWNRIAAPTRTLVEGLCAGAGPIELRFFGLRVTSVGVIAVATEETGLIRRIREAIAAMLPPPPGLEHRCYDLIHTTLARFSDPRPVPAEAVRRIEAVPVDMTVRVERLKIFRETLFPCLVGEELVPVPLG
jgi:hypothetical protein